MCLLAAIDTYLKCALDVRLYLPLLIRSIFVDEWCTHVVMYVTIMFFGRRTASSNRDECRGRRHCMVSYGVANKYLTSGYLFKWFCCVLYIISYNNHGRVASVIVMFVAH